MAGRAKDAASQDLEFAEPKSRPDRRIALIGFGALLIQLLCIVPVWNSVTLMRDTNYVFWHGTHLPAWMLGTCSAFVIFYSLTMLGYFKIVGPQVDAEQTVVMGVTMVITFLGLALMLISIPLDAQARETYTQLTTTCADYSVSSHRLFEYSQVLHNIRSTPECIGKFSVEECRGYREAPPYTTFLKAMESELHCTGFCFVGKDPHFASPMGLVETTAQSRPRRRGVSGSEALLSVADQPFPPTLFSNTNYKESCDAKSALKVKEVAGGIAAQTLRQGSYLVVVAIIVGLAKLAHYCVRPDDGDKA